MLYVVLEKAKKVYVPATAKRKAYYRYDPRTGKYHKLPHARIVGHVPSTGEKILEALKKILLNIGILEKKGLFTNEQKAHVRKALKDFEKASVKIKNEKQRQAIAKVLQDIRKELATPRKKETPKEAPKKKAPKLSEEILRGVKRLGYNESDIAKMSEHEAKAIYYNDIKKD